MTVIYHFKRTVLAPAIVGLSLSYSASCSLSFTIANDNLQRAEWLLSRRCKSSFRKDGHIHFEERIICHIEKRVGGAIFDWEQRLVLGFIRDFERIIISDLPSVSSCFQEGRFTMVNRISATPRRVPVIRFRYDGPDQRGFSFCEATIKSRKQFAARISHKETVALPLEQFYLTTELSNVVGISFIFVTSFGRYPCSGGNAFSSTTFPSTDSGALFLCTKILFGTHTMLLQP